MGLDWPLNFSIKVQYGGSCNGNEAEAYFDGRVDVQEAIGLSETIELDFGVVVDADGTIRLGLADSIISDPSGISVGGSIASGVYTFTGTPNAIVSASLSGSSSAGLTLGNFTSAEADLGTISLGPSGSHDVTLGADLTVAGASAAPGSNQLLPFTISVSYN